MAKERVTHLIRVPGNVETCTEHHEDTKGTIETGSFRTKETVKARVGLGR
jgi:hypothetical protein